ncbi:MAG: putative DNA-binding domain-containing protein [Tatlockia sp.]|nr:putative DNA-binding domain-containing protein [Tatlockia sp.]
MSNLRSVQNQFQNYLLNNQAEIQQSIVQTDKVSVSQRLAIYRDAYRSRLTEALGNNFPILSSYLGFDAFSSLSGKYIDKHPSPYRSIRWFGDEFALFLKEKGESYLAELAEFEWFMTLAFDATDDEQVQIEQMAAISPEAWGTLRFRPHASLKLMKFNWNVVDIWEAISKEQQPPEPQETATQTWALWRRDYLIRFYSLVDDEAWALSALIKGATFGEICEGLCNWLAEEEVGLRAASLLKGWIEAGLIAELDSEI